MWHIDFFSNNNFDVTIRVIVDYCTVHFRGSKHEVLSQLDKGFAQSPRIIKYKRLKKLGVVSSKVKHILQEGGEFKRNRELSRRTDGTKSRINEDTNEEYLLELKQACPCHSPLLDSDLGSGNIHSESLRYCCWTSRCSSCYALGQNVSWE